MKAYRSQLAPCCLHAAIIATAGCASPPPSRPDDLRGVRAAESASQPPARSVAPADPSRPAALLNGRDITWNDLRPILAESAGGSALREFALDRLLAAECAARNITITQVDLDAERRLLLDSITRESRTQGADAERLLERVRRTRGLGERRFATLLTRNAQMRRLVTADVSVSEDEVAQAFEMAHGERYRIRVIVVPTQTQASQLRADLAAGQGDLAARFSAIAARQSTDPSASRGGLTEPISPADPAYPASIRAAFKTLKPGEISPVIAVDRGYAIMILDQQVPADGATLVQSADAVRAEVRTRRERQAMDDVARRLLSSANLSALDRDLDWSLRATEPTAASP